MKEYIIIRAKNTEQVRCYVQKDEQTIYRMEPKGLFRSEFDIGQTNDGGLELSWCILGDLIENGEPMAMRADLPRLFLCGVLVDHPLLPGQHFTLEEQDIRDWLHDNGVVLEAARKRGAA